MFEHNNDHFTPLQLSEADRAGQLHPRPFEGVSAVHRLEACREQVNTALLEDTVRDLDYKQVVPNLSASRVTDDAELLLELLRKEIVSEPDSDRLLHVAAGLIDVGLIDASYRWFSQMASGLEECGELGEAIIEWNYLRERTHRSKNHVVEPIEDDYRMGAIREGVGADFPELITFVGLPGSGKSTVGTELAQHLGCPIVDLDARIEDEYGEDRDTLFDTMGTRGFGLASQKALADLACDTRLLSESPRLIVATGSLAPVVDPVLVSAVSTLVINMKANVDTLSKRLRHRTNAEPQWSDAGMLPLILELSGIARDQFYTIADSNIQTAGTVQYSRVEELAEILSGLQDRIRAFPENSLQRELFDSKYSEVPLSRYYPQVDEWIGSRIEYIRRNSGGENPQAMDLGSGDGRNTHYLLERQFAVDAVEVSGVGLRKTRAFASAEQLAGGLSCYFADMREFTLRDKEYDLVVVSTSLETISAGEVRQVCHGLEKMVKPGGYMLLTLFLDGEDTNTSPTNFGEVTSFKSGQVEQHFTNFAILDRHLERKLDTSHGPPHTHLIERLMLQARQVK